MSALRQMLASLWTTVWLGWRMAGVRGRLLLRRRSRLTMATATAPSFYLPAGEIPGDGVDYDVRELSADLVARLGGVRAELAGAARGTTARRARRRRSRRRRTASLAIAALVTLTTLGAGATALMTGSTGVPEVDRLLGIYKAGSSDPGAAKRPGPSGTEIQPKAGGPTGTVSTTLPDGSTVVSATYVARNGDVCLGLVDGYGNGPSGDVNCVSPSDLEGYARRDEGFIFGFRRYFGTVVLNGLISSRVTRVQGRDKPMDVSVGRLWKPPGGGRALRPFIAVGEGQASTFLQTSLFGLELWTDSGRRTELDGAP